MGICIVYPELSQELVKVGCRGFAGRSLCKVFALLGIMGAEKRKATRSAMEAAESL